MQTEPQTLLFADETAAPAPSSQRRALTFKANLALGRHGWLRLTPAYSRHLVARLVAPLRENDFVLDPFCGTGTTALTCAEHCIRADTLDINPFLVWLANTKLAHYEAAQISEAALFARSLRLAAVAGDLWRPPIKDIGKWWGAADLAALAALFDAIKRAELSTAARNLLFSAFCRVAIESAAVSFGHQSMSFKAHAAEGLADLHREDVIGALFKKRLAEVLHAASLPLDGTLAHARLGDSRAVDATLPRRYTVVITSPPYPNRMSYIRELRPYMYWLGYLADGRQAGELDWQAIGGTWGCATSNLSRWQPDPALAVPSEGFAEVVARIAERSPVLARYVHKYFEDCVLHFQSLGRVLEKNAQIHYIVGNSKFYDVMVHTERLYADLMRAAGFADVTVENIRKRSSKKELFEFVVSGRYVG